MYMQCVTGLVLHKLEIPYIALCSILNENATLKAMEM